MAGARTAAGGGPGHHRGDRLGMPAATLLGPAALRLEHGNDPAQALTLAVQLQDAADGRLLGRISHQRPALGPHAIRRPPVGVAAPLSGLVAGNGWTLAC